MLLRTGWSVHRGTVGHLAHPSLDPAAGQQLPAAGGHPCHHLVAARGGVIAEDLTALAGVEELVDPLVCLFPVRLEGADGAPAQAVQLRQP